MNTNTNSQTYTELDARKFIGQHVKTTSGEHGVVHHAAPSIDGTRIVLHITVSNWSVMSDNEHATLEPQHVDEAHHYAWTPDGDYVQED